MNIPFLSFSVVTGLLTILPNTSQVNFYSLLISLGALGVVIWDPGKRQDSEERVSAVMGYSQLSK